MTGIKENMKHDIRKDPRELEHEADQARAQVEHTLQALERRLSPSELLEQVMEVVKRNGGDFGHNLATQVRNNPLPTLLAGAGLTWLMAASSRAPTPKASVYDTGPSLGDRASSAAQSARSAASGTKSAAKGAAGAASQAASSVAGAARSTADSVAGASRAGARGVRDGYAYLSQEQPLVLGAMAVAAGAAIGALLPATEAEDHWMGEASEDATDRLKAEGRRRADQAKAAAAGTAEAAKREVESRSTDAPRGGRSADQSGEVPHRH